MEGQAACVAADAAAAITAALFAHGAGDSGVCENGCGALHRIALSADGGKAACIAAGAAPALVAARLRGCEGAAAALAALGWE